MAPDPIILIPLTQIAEDALPRDRTALDATDLGELRASILASGLRMPVEVFEDVNPNAPAPYGLLSGFRRLRVFRELSGEWGLPQYAGIPAILRAPASIPDALARMVEENDIRTDITPWDKARIVIEAVARGYFPNIDSAIDGLYAAADRQRRARIRAMCVVVEELPNHLTDAAALSQRQLLRLAAACRGGFADLIRDALMRSSAKSAAAQMALLDPIVREAEWEVAQPSPADPRPGRPRRMCHPRRDLHIRRERLPDGWCLRFTGPEAKGGLMEDIMDQIERDYGR